MAKGALGKKALRIGVICGGRLLQERLLNRGERIALGDLASPEWVGDGEDPSFTVFSFTRTGCTLFFDGQTQGKLMAGGAVVALKKLRADPSLTSKQGAWELPLAMDDRGKVSFDKITVLFQFVDVNDDVWVPLGEMDFRARFLDEDPVFLTSIGMWMGLAAILTVWVTTQDPLEFELEDLPEIYTQLQVFAPTDALDSDPEPEEVNDELEPEVADAEVAPRIDEDPPPQNDLQRAQDREQMRQDLLANNPLLAQTGEGLSFVKKFWGDDPGIDYDKALGGPSDKRGEEPGFRPGEMGGGPEIPIGVTDPRPVPMDPGPGTTPFVPLNPITPVVEEEEPTFDNDDGGNPIVHDVVSSYVGQLQYCYEKRIKVVPGLGGRVEIGWRVVDGKVESAWVVTNSTGDGELANCVVQRIKRWKFGPGIDEEVSWPFVFRTKTNN